MRAAVVLALLQAPVLLSAKPLVRREAFTGAVDSQVLQPDGSQIINDEGGAHAIDEDALEDTGEELDEGDDVSEGAPNQVFNDGLDEDTVTDQSADKDVEASDTNESANSSLLQSSETSELKGRRRTILVGKDQSHCIGLAHGPYYLAIGNFRFGQVDDSHFSASGSFRRRRYQTPKTMQIYRKDGTLHPGPRNVWNTFGHTSGTADGRLLWGPKFFQVGQWRMGAIDDNNFGVAHKDGKTVQTYRHDGYRDNPKTDTRLWAKPVSPLNTTFTENKIKFGKNFIQFGDTWRLGQVDANHASISWRQKEDGKGGPRRRIRTPSIFRMDGTMHETPQGHSPRSDWHTWKTAIKDCAFGIGY